MTIHITIAEAAIGCYILGALTVLFVGWRLGLFK